MSSTLADRREGRRLLWRRAAVPIPRRSGFHGAWGVALTVAVLAGALFGPASAGGLSANEMLIRRLIQEIRADTAATRHYTGRAELDAGVMQAMESVPRDKFVDQWNPDAAWDNVPLPIGHGQTISQPFIVALMTDLLEPRSTHRVLEIGTGSGYQAAVLAELVEHVFTIEIIEALATTATHRLARLGYENITVRHGDGYHGWPEEAPFDGIIVTAVAPDVPPALLAQLKPGGRMILPLGPERGAQNLVLVEKLADGSVHSREVLPVMFVPLTGDH